MKPLTNIPDPIDILAEIPTIGDCITYPEYMDDKELDDMLKEMEGYYIDNYYHESFNNAF